MQDSIISVSFHFYNAIKTNGLATTSAVDANLYHLFSDNLINFKYLFYYLIFSLIFKLIHNLYSQITWVFNLLFGILNFFGGLIFNFKMFEIIFKFLFNLSMNSLKKKFNL
jgi:hypothetical protein